MSENPRFNDDQTANAYERLLVPRIFRPWGLLLLEKVGLRTGQRILDVATGPGTLARLAAEHIGAAGAICGVDLSANMLAQAKAKAPVQGGAPIVPIWPDLGPLSL
jgi:ubiquinone/menaquinone biosynthesis C-methylase UbiE